MNDRKLQDNLILSSKRLFFVLLLLTTLYILPTHAASAATLFFYPQQILLVPGEEALVELRLDTGGVTINAIELEGTLSGLAAVLRGIDNSGSAIDIFVERPTITSKSHFRLVGGIPAGLAGDHLLARIALRAEVPGLATLSFTPSAVKVLRADGSGKSVPMQFMSSQVQVGQKSKDYLTLSSNSHPDQNQWYATTRGHIHFEFDPAASYSYVVTANPLEEPDNSADVPEGTPQWQGDTKLEDLPEGISYFGIKKVGSSFVSRYRLMNDITEPVWLEVKKNDGTIETEGRPFLTFLAQDSVSGVEYYEMRVDNQEPFLVVSPQPLPDEYAMLSIRAYDRAGNFIERFIPGPQKHYSLWVWMVVLLILLVWVSGIIDTKRRKVERSG
jgi:hypothetical protein